MRSDDPRYINRAGFLAPRYDMHPESQIRALLAVTLEQGCQIQYYMTVDTG